MPSPATSQIVRVGTKDLESLGGYHRILLVFLFVIDSTRGDGQIVVPFEGWPQMAASEGDSTDRCKKCEM